MHNQSAENADVMGHCSQKRKKEGMKLGQESREGGRDARVSDGCLLFTVPKRERCQPVTYTRTDLQC